MDSSENGTSQRVLTKCGLRHDRMFRRGDDMSKAAAFCLLALATLSAQSSAPFSPFVAVPWCNIGPASTGTPIVDLAVVEKDPRVICAATASSGVWKTTDAGISWAPTFENENTVALGGVAVSQSNPQIVWVATGEPNDPQRVYFLQTPICVSTDGGAQDNITVRGATWDTISPDLTKQIVIDPKYRMSDYGTLRWIDASPRKAGWLATGSDDGLIIVTEDDGKTWRKAAALPGVPAGDVVAVAARPHADHRDSQPGRRRGAHARRHGAICGQSAVAATARRRRRALTAPQIRPTPA